MRESILLLCGLGGMLAGCTTNPPMAEPAGMPDIRAASAAIQNAAGLSIGQASVNQIGDSLQVRIDASALPQGAYGAHIHAVGRCDPPSFASAGPHWNPTGQQHGRNNPQGMHKGDLPNLMVGTDGRGTLEITIPGAMINAGGAALLDQDGSAIVIHQGPDDYRTDPSGNSGSRIACGVFG